MRLFYSQIREIMEFSLLIFRYMAYKNDSLLNSPARPMDFLYSRLATLSALQSYAATAGYYLSNPQQQTPTPPILTDPSRDQIPSHLERLHSVSTKFRTFKKCETNCMKINNSNYNTSFIFDRRYKDLTNV